MAYRKNFAQGEKVRSADMNTNFSVLQSTLFVVGEVPSGVVDGANKVFTPANQFVTNSTRVFVNPPIASGASLAGTTSTVINTVSTSGVSVGQLLTFVSGTASGQSRVISAIVPGVSITVTPAFSPAPTGGGGENFTVSGPTARQIKGTHYLETPANVSITFTIAPATGSIILVDYTLLNP